MKKSDFLKKAKSSVSKEVEIEDVGKVKAISITGKDQSELMSIISGVKDGDKDSEQKMLNFNKEVIKRSIVDDDGEFIFDTADEVSDLPLSIIKQLLKEAQDISGMSIEAKEEIEKN